MVKLWNGLPCSLRVTRRAVGAQLPAVRVLVTGRAFRLKAKVRLGLVTLIALQGAVLAF